MTGERDFQTEYLDSFYTQNEDKAVVVYGRQFTGAYEWVYKYCEDKDFIILNCSQLTNRRQCVDWSRQLGRDDTETIHNGKELLEIVSSGINRKVLILNEFQNLLKGEGELLPEILFQMSNKDQWNILLILFSTSVNFVENSMISRLGSSSTYLQGFLKYREASFQEFLKSYSIFHTKDECHDAKTVMEIYSIVGGDREFYSYLDRVHKTEDLIKLIIMDQAGPMSFQRNRILEEELRELSVYQTILCELAEGHNKLNDIYNRTGFSRAKISVYLKNLMEIGLVEKIFNFEGARSDTAMKGIYGICHSFTAFNSLFLVSKVDKMAEWKFDEFYNSNFAGSITKFSYESARKVLQEYLENLCNRGAFGEGFYNYGRWIGKSGEIPFLAEDKEGRVFVCFLKWTEEALQNEEIVKMEELLNQAGINPFLIGFVSLGGYSEDAGAYISNSDRFLEINPDELTEIYA